MKVVLNAFKFDVNGVSESYLAAKWLNVISSRFDTSVISTSCNNSNVIHKPSKSFEFGNRFLNKINAAVKFDYFVFNHNAEKKFKKIVADADIFHHIAPVAPRYPVGLSKYSQKFILGPVAGGLRVPTDFRSEVEGSEEYFYKLRNLDRFRFALDRSLISTYERADTILIAGNYLKEILPSKFSEKCKQMLDVGVDVEDYEFILRERSNRKLRLLYVGRVVPYKGLIYLLKAISMLSKEDKKDVHLTVVGFVGDSEYEKLCVNYINANGLESFVSVKSYLPKSEAIKAYQKADIFCFPSLAEAGGTVVLESMASGLPVLAAKLGGPAVSICDKSGILVNADSRDEFVTGLNIAILGLLSGKIDLLNLSVNARNRIIQKFSWQARLEQISNVYNSVY